MARELASVKDTIGEMHTLITSLSKGFQAAKPQQVSQDQSAKDSMAESMAELKLQVQELQKMMKPS